jgi:Ubiquitin-activating enzyme E1 FCCH domain
MGQYLGLVGLGTALRSSHVTRNTTTSAPVNADSAPAYRVYGPGGLMANGTGNLSLKDPSAAGGTITAATNAAPIVITSAGHGLTTGTLVTISGVTGNTAANGTFQVTVVDANTFSLNGSAGNGAYVSGGVWYVAGLYDINFTPTGANGFVQGQNYTMLVTWAVAGVQQEDVHTFTCV